MRYNGIGMCRKIPRSFDGGFLIRLMSKQRSGLRISALISWKSFRFFSSGNILAQKNKYKQGEEIG
jgi:hypothetical protein